MQNNTQESWEEEEVCDIDIKQFANNFEEAFNNNSLCQENNEGCVCKATEWIIENLHALLSKQAEEISEAVEGLWTPSENEETKENQWHRIGYNQALADLSDNIK